MQVGEAKQIAAIWVQAEGSAIPGFGGAFFHGSVHSLADHDPLPESSDLDIMIVRADDEPGAKPGKFMYRGVMLEVSFISPDDVRSAEQILATYHLAGSFRYPGIIADPTGHLTDLQAEVGRAFARRRWVRARCDDAQQRVHRNLESIDAASTFHDKVTAWLFAGGVTTHLLLVAGLKNPTVRKRYLEVKRLLAEYDLSDHYDSLLDLIGAASITRERAQAHLDALADAFDCATTIISTPFFFAADISPAARPVAIGGSQELIDQRFQREAIFWIVATYARCMSVFAADGSGSDYKAHDIRFRNLLTDLGIRSEVDLRRGKERILAALPGAARLAEEIITRNPEIIDVSG